VNWLEIKLDTAPEALNALSEELTALGVDGLIIDDEADFKTFVSQNRDCWGEVDEALLREKTGVSRLTFYLADDDAGHAALDGIRAALRGRAEVRSLQVNGCADEDWENNWKAFYKPMEIGRRLLVIPAWETAPTGDRVPLLLNPGLTFGTGSHATTRLCLAALDESVHGGEKVLDLGCGSGILSIAALALGAGDAFACDIDEKCVGVAYENAALNGIDRTHYTVRAGDVVHSSALQREFGTGYDIVVANIVADVILALTGEVRPFLKPGGLFLTSGIIDARGDEVAAALEKAGWSILRRWDSEGWVAFLCQ
jgi:ribosomal protein L11 methyltransferase